jgi:molecular chaperone GrpE
VRGGIRQVSDDRVGRRPSAGGAIGGDDDSASARAESEVPVEVGPAEPGASAAEETPETATTPPATGAEEAVAFKDRWLRAEADLQNYRRRAAREREEAWRGAEESVMIEIITALDDLDRALGTARDSGAPEPWVEGVRLVANRLVDYLARQGVAALDPLGQPFDPAFHEAILEVEVPGARAGDVAQVVLKGWRRGDRVLRAARVVVARPPAGEK